ncbi:MAG TPA: 2-phospho-L-lactate transferase [Dehalococcoidia bacterium]|jgi:LPPG:FO 2-phospho-L-lactate transferase|nr:2-phospho-L-lactate transferase [Dehalococcoidia bacterium]
MDGKILAFAGGVGGAKLALGLSLIIPPERLVICVNTGDDDSFHGLHVSPDLDTMMYTLAGLSDPQFGWGIQGDTFTALNMLKQYGADAWFNLGDRDFATHIRRTQLLGQGATLSQVTRELCESLGVRHTVIPMSDDSVRTVLGTPGGDLSMQEYFVRQRAEPVIQSITYVGAEAARPSPPLVSALNDAVLIVFCPSNPALSLGPILALPGVVDSLKTSPAMKIAVSPIVGGDAVKGPAGKIMAELGQEVSCVGIASLYKDFCDILVIDNQDSYLSPQIDDLGVRPVVDSIIMQSESDKVALAQSLIALSNG